MSESVKTHMCLTLTRWMIAILFQVTGLLAILGLPIAAFAVSSVATQLWLFMPTVIKWEKKLLDLISKDGK